MLTARDFALICHSATPCPEVTGLRARLGRADGEWHVQFQLTGDIARLRVPAPSPAPAFTDGLWQHTCFELFAGNAVSSAYREFNFSPSGDWAAYAFSAERVRDHPAPTLPAPRIACTHDARTLTLQAWLPAADMDGPIGLTAVIETQAGQLSYWALQHPAPRPDFHHRAGWTARVPDFQIKSASSA